MSAVVFLIVLPYLEARFEFNAFTAHMGRLKSAIFAAICGALLLLSQKTAAQEMRRIYYGTSASPAHLPVWVARDAGLFARHGLNVEPVQVRGGSLITLAIITGDLPFSGVGAESVAAYARLFKPAPVVPDKGIENVVRDLMRRRPEFKEYLGWPGPFRENGPLEKVLLEK